MENSITTPTRGARLFVPACYYRAPDTVWTEASTLDWLRRSFHEFESQIFWDVLEATASGTECGVETTAVGAESTTTSSSQHQHPKQAYRAAFAPPDAAEYGVPMENRSIHGRTAPLFSAPLWTSTSIADTAATSPTTTANHTWPVDDDPYSNASPRMEIIMLFHPAANASNAVSRLSTDLLHAPRLRLNSNSPSSGVIPVWRHNSSFTSAYSAASSASSALQGNEFTTVPITVVSLEHSLSNYLLSSRTPPGPAAELASSSPRRAPSPSPTDSSRREQIRLSPHADRPSRIPIPAVSPPRLRSDMQEEADLDVGGRRRRGSVPTAIIK